ncbi:hypothetical protein Y032_0473g2091 [Ancylostoma ceylanicum]|uniref:Uncharacterized protein n=1 Tax=Ancylostoma ceylanicum TaxID=53326 RepID=A0A016WXU2_9BILA|nr:hypothetical protein Y032_0473g2091 [Ancylostoma ceylanicum]
MIFRTKDASVLTNSYLYTVMPSQKIDPGDKAKHRKLTGYLNKTRKTSSFNTRWVSFCEILTCWTSLASISALRWKAVRHGDFIKALILGCCKIDVEFLNLEVWNNFLECEMMLAPYVFCTCFKAHFFLFLPIYFYSNSPAFVVVFEGESSVHVR